MTEVIHTERLVLRRFRREDSARLVALLNDLDVVRWLTNVPFPFKIEDADNFILNLAPQVHDAFAIETEGQVIGTMSAGSELGYWVGQNYWGKGFATEGARAIVARHFGNSKSDLASGYHLGNDRSRAVLSKIGFRPTGQRPAKVASTNEDVIIQEMTLSRTDWKGAQ